MGSSLGAREAGDNRDVHLLRGREAILGSKSILDELAQMSGQRGASDDLAYHLSTPDALKKNPCLLLVPKSVFGETSLSAGGFSGAVLLFEYKIFGMGSKLYASADTTGRRAVIAPTAHRARAAAYACRCLVAEGAEIAMTSIYDPGDGSIAEAAISKEFRDCERGRGQQAIWSLIPRNNPLYLPIAETFDETLASIGKKTRTNLRYYRKRAEHDLNCVFVPDATLGVEEFLAFNRRCLYPVSDELARWRYESLAMIEQPFLHGIQDGTKQWLSLASGRLTGDQAVLEWQCNRADLPAASLSTVMRSYLIDHAVKLRMRRLYFEGGTPSSLQKSFVVEGAADLTLCRRSAYVWMIRKFAARLFPPKNYLAQILTDKNLTWSNC